MPPRYSQLGSIQGPSDIARLMALALERPDLLSLAAGFTDSETLPVDAVSAAARALEADPKAYREALQYGSNRGRPLLRRAIAERLRRQDGVDDDEEGPSEDQLLVLNGSQQALYLALQSLCDPGDLVLVEAPTYFVFLETLRGLGLRAVTMPVDACGSIDPEGLEALLDDLEGRGEKTRLKAAYFVSYYANPTGRSIPWDNKTAVAAILSRKAPGLAIIEDAAYRDLNYEKPWPAPSFLRLPEDAPLHVLYTGTLTKPFATGLKVGYAACSDEDWRGRLLSMKGQHDFGTAHFAQALLELAVGQGAFARQLELLRRTYRSKRDVLLAAIEKPLAALGWQWEVPEGGLYLWLTAPEGVSTGFESALGKRCLEEGVFYVPGLLCYGNRERDDGVRLSYASLDEAALAEAGRRFARAAESL